MSTNGVKAMQKSGGVIQYLIGLSFAPPTNTAQLVAHDLIWFNDLKNEFRVNEPLASETDPVKVKAKSEIHLIVGKKEEDLVGQDLADLETWLIELLPLEALKQKVNSLREDLQDLAGDAAWKKILPTLANQVATATEGQLRPEARRLQQELHWRTSIQPQAQNTRLKLMFRVIAMFALILILGCVRTVIFSFTGVIVIAGVFGALISCIQRIQSADLASSRATSMTNHDGLTLGVTISPLLGGIFAVVFVLALLAGSITPGFVIPEVTVLPTNCVCVGFSNAPSQLANRTEGVHQPGISPVGEHAEPKPAPPPTNNLNLTTGQGRTTNLQTTNALAVEGRHVARADSLRFAFFGLNLCFTSGKDVVLLILWAFVAGFSERLVPDLLTRLGEAKKS